MARGKANRLGNISNRRDWLINGAAGTALTFLARRSRPGAAAETACGEPSEPDVDKLRATTRDLIRQWLYSHDDIDRWLTGKAFPFSKYDPELGYLHRNRRFKEGLDDSICTYTYDSHEARRMSAFADRPCRINTYGNSFTSCEQVSDPETWQEILAAHLGEPVRNFGIGGYSVYQAYLRMRREEQRVPAQYVIFNIYPDDHYRNLNGWQRPRFLVNRRAANGPVPHVKVDPDRGTFIECPNPCPTPESLYRLCDLDAAFALFADDYGIVRMARAEVLNSQGVKGVPSGCFDDLDYTRHALFATMRIVELVQQYAAKIACKVLYVLSTGVERIRRFVHEGRRFDADLVTFFDRHSLPYIDLLQTHLEDRGNADLETYLGRHFMARYTPLGNSGHYTPLGNFFCAFALKDKLLKMLEPPPPAYTTAPDA